MRCVRSDSSHTDEFWRLTRPMWTTIGVVENVGSYFRCASATQDFGTMTNTSEPHERQVFHSVADRSIFDWEPCVAAGHVSDRLT